VKVADVDKEALVVRLGLTVIVGDADPLTDKVHVALPDDEVDAFGVVEDV
jgi:hypothetical protein